MTMPPVPGHIWWHSALDAQNHLYPVRDEDDEPEDGIYEAACEKLVVKDKLVREEYGPYCHDCLLKLGRHQAARLEDHLNNYVSTYDDSKSAQDPAS
ncbi:hypothetical protein UK23_29445 [Lentzea aerocolonigenes]|uniref:Uncharacterized protein n=1 Tax=Lentzea aerocolonigenes TaxID=68170 RepID=A0A0F0GSQ8_LENAE|nr:hypothetical protein [Lentzea aerocolonigenes]KJK44428.1 hypothetical protein UK23_29445 [Lentzea aerocolonigenes]